MGGRRPRAATASPTRPDHPRHPPFRHPRAAPPSFLRRQEPPRPAPSLAPAPFPNSSLPPSRGEVRWGVRSHEPPPPALHAPIAHAAPLSVTPTPPHPSFLRRQEPPHTPHFPQLLLHSYQNRSAKPCLSLHNDADPQPQTPAKHSKPATPTAIPAPQRQPSLSTLPADPEQTRTPPRPTSEGRGMNWVNRRVLGRRLAASANRP